MMKILFAVVRRDLLLAWRRRADVLTTLAFFIIVASLFPLGVGPEANLLRTMAPGVLWVSALLATLLSVTRLFAADYVGALVGGLAFPFLLLPVLGQLTGALLTGMVNAAAGGALVLWVFRRDLTPRSRWTWVPIPCFLVIRQLI